MVNITAIVKTKNCDDRLCNLLESIKDFNEIIVVDENSTDDTIEIAKEYKAKIIYATKPELLQMLNLAINEASNDWIFVLEDDEIIPEKLILSLQDYIENPKKNKFVLSFNQKTFYLNKEVKSENKKNILRFFKKGYCDFKHNYSPILDLKKGRVFKGLRNNTILKYQSPDIASNFIEDLYKFKLKAKYLKKAKPNVIFKTLASFLYFYFIKKAFLDGQRGFIFAFYKTINEFVGEAIIFERKQK